MGSQIRDYDSECLDFKCQYNECGECNAGHNRCKHEKGAKVIKNVKKTKKVVNTGY